MLVDPIVIEAWLTSPHRDLGGRTPLQVIREGYADAVEGMLAGALEGIPS
ncbi:MAG: antitoxin Xre/MbcA/ParS toxin-binding domain-containing protein [Dehalococcoidia bacterium]